MRRFIAMLILLGTNAIVLGGALPLTPKEVGLMLRSGYASSTVLKELSKRHCAGDLGPDDETALLNAGASAELIAALKSGTYAVTAKEAAAREQAARQNAHIPMPPQANRAANAIFQAQVRTAQSDSRTGPHVLYESLKGDLVRYGSGSVVHADDEAVAGKKLIALYFSAHWCPPCRKFTPQLVDFYNRVSAQHPEFEVIFVSCDRSASAMQGYMQETNMPWPAVDYEKVASKTALRKYCGNGIPCLVLIDASGKVLSDSFAGSQYLGPQKVLADIDAMLATGSLGVAQTR